MTDIQMNEQIILNQSKDLQVNRMSALQLDDKRTAVTLEWNNISYSLPIKDPNGGCCGARIRKQILNGMNGVAKPGQLIAIMGPSGSGKTTLLNVLAGRIVSRKGSKLEGEIKVNGVNRNCLGSKFARIAAFVQQDDVLFSLQTVRETLLTAARLRLPKDMCMVEKNQRVDAIISELGLIQCESTHIGDDRIRGVSGGERKRCNIGVELMQDPSLLFLDEPTSGLDSFQALNVIETLKILCQSGTTVILSIHQPRSSIFALFDQMIILADGNVIYDGKPGKTSVAYFASLGFQCPDLFNPADYFLDIVSVDNRIELLTKAYKKQHKNSKNYNNAINTSSSLLDKFDIKTARSGCCTQMAVLSTRNIRQLFRNKFALFMQLFMSIFFALFLSALYSETDWSSQKSIQDRTGILFFICINQSFSSVMNTINTFVLEKAIVMRERQSKSYYISSYYVTKVLTALPLDIITPLLFASIVYWIVGLNDDPFVFFIFCVITVAVTLAGIGLGFCLGAIAPTVNAASAMGPTVMILMILFGGFYINSENIPDWMQFLSNLSIIQWTYSAFVINEFTDVTFVCDVSDAQCVTNGEHVIELLSFDQYTLSECITYLVILLASFHLIACLVLRFNRTKYLDVTQFVMHNEQDTLNETQINTDESNIVTVPEYNVQLASASEIDEEFDNGEQP